MKKAESIGPILTIVAILIALVTLVFGDNLFAQITGHSFFNKTPAATSTAALAPRPRCPTTMTCYADDFHDPNPVRWCNVSSEGVDFSSGHLLVSAPADISRELHPCDTLDDNLQFVELTLALVETGGTPGNAHAGLGMSMDNDQYAEFFLDSAGNAVLTHGVGDNPSQVDETVTLDDPGAVHILRIEYTTAELIFYVDGAPLTTRLQSTELGHWFYIHVGAWPEGSVTAQIDYVFWGGFPP